MSLEQEIKANTEAVLLLLAVIKSLPADLAKVLSAVTPAPVAKAPGADVGGFKPTVSEFIASLTINWKWQDADEPAVFKAGKAAEADAFAKAKEFGAKYVTALEAAKKKGLSGEPIIPGADNASSGTSGASQTEVLTEKGDVIALPDLQKLTQQIQAFKTKDADNGVKAMEELKELVKALGITRISDPALDVAKYPGVKASLEAIVAKYKIPAVA